jgi:hypothetical protein
MAQTGRSEERRRYKRISAGFPVSYRVKGTTIMGKAINACNEGILVESHLDLKTAFQIVGMLRKKRRQRFKIEFSHKQTYKTEGEIRHFHLDFSGTEPCRSLAGFFVPKME